MRYQTPYEQIIVPAHINYLPELRKFIARVASKYRFSPSETNALTISVDEACTNIIKHGYQNRPMGSITMKVQIKKDRLEVELIDYGISFDPNLVTDPNLSLYVQNGKKGGLGIFIMKRFLDEIHYVNAGQKNILRLIKLRQDGSVRPFLVPFIYAFQRLKTWFFSVRNTK